MSIVKISDATYKEFKDLLDENELENYIIRLNLAGMACSGPVFNIIKDDKNENDEVEVINEITFLVGKELIESFGGFEIQGTEENGRGLMIEPFNKPESGGCSSCSSCGH
ncbi:HesB-like protein [Clostridium frigidicarnis]|uniref:HesB-like selenoprotein n=1 Tax=Clostridium frigidicarnis TaxID=84698 RepID=A0A1I0Z0K8_9CLOT|nr:HesB-like protein [Clostridium frigidicarnis]SFB18952.1 HesB-like selenoprotein [Clostridium frigidicarnis]